MLTKEQIVTQLVANLLHLPVRDRTIFARAQLTKTHPSLILAFDAIPRAKLATSVLFVSLNPHSRETRFAAAARLAGWNPLLVHLESPKYQPEDFFSYCCRLDDPLQLVLACWLFPGALVHGFVLRGDNAHLLALTKHRPLVLDIYDTGSGFTSLSQQQRQAERATIALADGITHRDLRIKYLQKFHGYSLPRHNIFIHDPLPVMEPCLRPNRSDAEIHVVSVGWVGSGDNSILRIARALCTHGVHLHIYFNPNQNAVSEAGAYRELQTQTGCLHIEQPVYGDAYWKQLAGYDFGLSIFEPYIYGEQAHDYTDDYLRGCGSSRLADYIGTNLGVIVTPGLRFQYFWARHFASCVVTTSREFMENPRPMLETALGTKRSRNCLSISTQGIARRLGDFYARVAAQARNTPSKTARFGSRKQPSPKVSSGPPLRKSPRYG